MLKRFFRSFMVRSTLLMLCLALLFSPVIDILIIGELLAHAQPAEKAMPIEVRKGKDRFPGRPGKGAKTEISEWRSSKARHFMKDDGTFQAEVTARSRFFQDKVTKKWQDIDNSLVGSTKPGYTYKNNANRFDTHFASDATGGRLAAFSQNGATLEFSPVGASGGTAVVKNNLISYSNVFKNVDLEYTVDSDMMQEEIVLKKPDAPTSFTFQLKLTNLYWSPQKDGSYHFMYSDTGKFAFSIPKPHMYENGKQPHMSDQVTQTIRKEGDDVFLDIKADPDWIVNPDRKFPIVIDPPITTEQNFYLDTFASQTYPTTAYSDGPHVYTGQTSSYGKTEAYILFPLPGLPDGAYVTNATISLYNYLSKTKATPVQLSAISQNWWPETAVQWNNRPGHRTKVETTVNVDSANWFQFSIPSLAQEWYSGNIPNYGVALTASPDTSEGVGFASSNHTDATYRPTMTIDYTLDPDGVNAFWTYTMSGGMPFKGNLNLQATDLSVGARGQDMVINRVYNSRQRTVPGVFGRGWLSVLDMKMKELYGSVLFLDDNGTRHLFDRLPEDRYVPPAGVPLSLVRELDYWKVTTNDNQVYAFNRSDGRIASVTDESGQKLTFSTEAGTGDTLMTDSSGRVMRVHYGSNGLVNYVLDPKGRKATYLYDANNMLSTVTITLGSETVTSAYTYVQSAVDPSLWLLSTAKDPNGNIRTYTHDNFDRLSTVKKKVDTYDTTATYGYPADSSIYPRIVTVTTTSTAPNANTEVTTYTTNDNANVIQRDVKLNGTQTATTTYTWGANNWLQAMTAPNAKLAGQENNYTTTIQYGNNGKPIQVTTPDGKDVRINYDPLSNQLVSYKDKSGNVTGQNILNNKPVDTTDSVGNTTMRDFDSTGNITSLTAAMSLADNRIFNSGFEVEYTPGTPSGWSGTRAPVGTERYEVDPNNHTGGFKSLHLVSASTSGLGAQTDYTMPVTQNQLYNLSADFKLGANTTAELRLSFFNSAGAKIGNDVTGLSLSKSGGSSTSWQRKSTSYIAPDGAVSAKLFAYVDSTGEAWFDNMMFEGGAGRSGNLLINNPSFDNDIDHTGLADGWYKPYPTTANVWIDYSQSEDGIASEKMSGDPSGYKYVIQRMDAGGYKGTRFIVSGWGMQTGVPATGGTWGLQVELFNSDGTMDYLTVPFDRTRTGWQQVSQVVDAPKDFYKVGYKMAFDYMPSTATAWFDDVKLSMMNTDSATVSEYNFADNSSFEYDKDGTGWPDGWYRYTSNPAGNVYKSEWVDVAKSGGNIYTGNRSIRIDNPTYAEALMRANDKLPFDSSRTYTVVGYIKTVNVPTTSGAVMRIHCFDANNNALGAVESEVITGTKDWTRARVVLNAANAPVGTAKVSVGLQRRAGAGTVYFDNVRFQEGEFRTQIGYESAQNYMSSVTDPAGNAIKLTPEATTGNIKSLIDAQGNNYAYEHNMQNRITKATFPYQGAIGQTPSNKSFTYAYDNNGNVTSVADPNGRVWTYLGYNEEDQIKDYQDNATFGTTLNTNHWTYAYDPSGRLRQTKMPDGKTTDITRDNAGRISNVAFSGGTAAAKTFSYAYDLNGNMTQFGESQKPQFVQAFDNMGRLTKVTEPDPNSKNTIAHTYDASSRLTKVSVNYDDYASWDYVYDYDSVGNVKSIKDVAGDDTMYYLYDESRHRIKSFSTNGMSTYYEYDNSGRKTQVRTESGGLAIDKFRYEYDANNNVKKIWNDTAGTWTEHTYDSLGQLLLEKDSAGNSNEYQYDVLGNRTLVIRNGATTVYGYNPERNRLLTAGTRSYSYDASGSVLSDTVNAYAWGSDNKLASVTPAGGAVITYTYDALGRRETKTVGNLFTRYHYDGDQLSYVTQWDGSAFKIWRFEYDEMGMPIVMRYNSKSYWYHYNQHGDIIRMTDEGGNTVCTYSYDAYGRPNPPTIVQAGSEIPNLNPFRYAAYYYDADTGLYYLQNRYYDPEVGRFLSKDPNVLQVGNALSENQYTYAANNPVMLVDSEGTRPMAADPDAERKDPSILQTSLAYMNQAHKAVEKPMSVVKSIAEHTTRKEQRYSSYDPQHLAQSKRGLASEMHHVEVKPYIKWVKGIKMVEKVFLVSDTLDIYADPSLSGSQKWVKFGLLLGSLAAGAAGGAIGGALGSLGGPAGTVVVGFAGEELAGNAYEKWVEDPLKKKYGITGD